MTESVTLQKIKLSCQEWLDGSALQDMKLEAIHDEFTRRFGMQLRTFVLGEKVREIDEKVPFEVPASTWQFFKWEFFPQWLLRYSPVKTKTWSKTVHFEQVQCFPKIKEILPSNELKYEFTCLDSSVEDFSPFTQTE